MFASQTSFVPRAPLSSLGQPLALSPGAGDSATVFPTGFARFVHSILTQRDDTEAEQPQIVGMHAVPGSPEATPPRPLGL